MIVTSNRTRDLSDALRRRCLYLWIGYPSLKREIEILRARLPGINKRLAGQIARFMEFLRASRSNACPARPRAWTGRSRSCGCIEMRWTRKRWNGRPAAS